MNSKTYEASFKYLNSEGLVQNNLWRFQYENLQFAQPEF